MLLYHASNVEVKRPMLVGSNRMLDFVQMDARRFATYLAVVISPAGGCEGQTRMPLT